MKKKNSHQASGFSLVELMIALVLGTLIVGGMISVFISSKQTYNNNDRLARLQENGRMALYYLTNDLRHANFWGPLVNVQSIGSFPANSLTGTCAAWASTDIPVPSNPNQFIGSSTPKTHPLFTTNCLDPADIKDNTSAVAIKRVSQGPVNFTTDLSRGDVFLRTNSVSGKLLVKGVGDGSTAPPGGFSDWEYEPKLYFIRPYSVRVQDDIPTLCSVQDNPNIQTQCFVEGIEDMHIEYGVDQSEDGVPDVYQSDPSATEMLNVVSIKVYLLVRDLTPDSTYQNTDSYQLGSKSISALNDHFHRTVFSTTVIPQTQRSLPVR